MIATREIEESWAVYKRMFRMSKSAPQMIFIGVLPGCRF